ASTVPTSAILIALSIRGRSRVRPRSKRCHEFECGIRRFCADRGSQAMHRKILIMGLPGAGKTTLAKALAPRLNAVHFNADDVRENINKDLGFSEVDRIEHARRMGWLCDQVVKIGCVAVADFICPTPETRAAFTCNGEAFIVWMDRVAESRFADTN